MNALYYMPPSDKIFEEVKDKCIALWETIENSPDQYTSSLCRVEDKIATVKNTRNVEGEFMYLVRMFDLRNHKVLAKMLSDEARGEIRTRMIDSETHEMFINF